jgi:hypothetical protein
MKEKRTNLDTVKYIGFVVLLMVAYLEVMVIVSDILKEFDFIK